MQAPYFGLIAMSGSPAESVFHGSDVDLHYFDWGSRAADAPLVLLVHATGFHARCWDQTVAHLPDGYRVIAPDMRGHGRSGKAGPYTWASFSQDLAELIDHLDISGALGVGHSLGGHCVTYAASLRPEAFSRLLLIDPVILPPSVYAQERNGDFSGPEQHPVARRRNQWASWQEMYQRFADRAPFSQWQPEVLEDYCRFGLLPDSHTEGLVLACPPLVEASIYFGSSTDQAGADIYARVAAISCPVTVLRAPPRDFAAASTMDFSASPTWDRLATQFQRGRDVLLPDLTHFIPMQDPALVARFIDDPHAQSLS